MAKAKTKPASPAAERDVRSRGLTGEGEGPSPAIAFFPRFDEKRALVGWDELPDTERLGQPRFSAIPDVPVDGTRRWNGEAFEPIPMWLPRFDAEGGLVGFDETTLDKVPLGALAFDHLPDNACDGRYRYDHNLKRFEPRPHILVRIGDTATINKMVVAGIVGLVDRATLPLAVQDQIRFIETTSPETVAALKKKYAALVSTVKV